MAGQRRREKPYGMYELARVEPPVGVDQLRLFGDRSERGQIVLTRRLQEAEERGKRQQWPYQGVHRVARWGDLEFCDVHFDPPNYVEVFDYIKRPRVVRDRYGRVLFMDRGIKERKRIRPEDFTPVVRFEPLYPPHPDPANASEEEKALRVSAYLNAYAQTGIITASAQYVGVSYFWILIWVNESPERVAQLQVAKEAAKLVMVDVGRQRAMQGDSAMMRFFIERDNPEQFGKGKRDSLPDGVTQESVVSALAMIQAAQAAADQKDSGEVKQFPTLVDQKSSVADLINNLPSPPRDG